MRKKNKIITKKVNTLDTLEIDLKNISKNHMWSNSTYVPLNQAKLMVAESLSKFEDVLEEETTKMLLEILEL